MVLYMRRVPKDLYHALRITQHKVKALVCVCVLWPQQTQMVPSPSGIGFNHFKGVCVYVCVCVCSSVGLESPILKLLLASLQSTPQLFIMITMIWCRAAATQRLSHTHIHTLSHAHTLTRTHSHTHTLSHAHTLTHTKALTHTHTHTLSHTQRLSHTVA